MPPKGNPGVISLCLKTAFSESPTADPIWLSSPKTIHLKNVPGSDCTSHHGNCSRVRAQCISSKACINRLLYVGKYQHYSTHTQNTMPVGLNLYPLWRCTIFTTTLGIFEYYQPVLCYLLSTGGWIRVERGMHVPLLPPGVSRIASDLGADDRCCAKNSNSTVVTVPALLLTSILPVILPPHYLVLRLPLLNKQIVAFFLQLPD